MVLSIKIHHNQGLCAECRIQHFGFAYVKDKIVPALACDTALRAAFGSGDAATESNVLATLDGYINELRFLAIDLLV